MMNRAIVFTLAVLLALPCFAQEWVAVYDGPASYDDEAHAIAVDGAGNLYVTGESEGAGTERDYATIKYGPAGDTLWVRRYDGPASADDLAQALDIDAAGYVYVTGSSYGSGTYRDYATIKYTPDGDTVYVRRYHGPANNHDLAFAIAADGAGNAYVTGQSYGSNNNYDYLTIKYYPNGDTAWVRSYNGPNNFYDEAYAIAVDGAGNVYAAGWSLSGGGASYDYVTIKYNSAGDMVWTGIYNGPESSSDYANAVVVDDEYVYVTGKSFYSATSYDYATIKYLAVGVAEGPGSEIEPPRLAIYPNPSYSAVRVRYSLSKPGWVILNIYDACGRLVKTLVDGSRAAGNHTVQWDGNDNAGKEVTAGIYFSRIEGGDFTAVTKLTVLK
ncbi:SBBP repeat-containing protein [candidate division WOR-3 bacterium]|nr:SBBP repeat-containing protein [candidate division WOR-3 bacterium]